MIPVDDTLARLLAAVEPLPPEEVELRWSHGRVLAAPVYSAHDLPPFDQSAVDGYAVRHADIVDAPVTLPVSGTIAARGHATRPTLEAGTAMRIFTGGVAPEGADTMVRQEATQATDDTVSITEPVALGADYRRAGEELPASALVAEAGVLVTPGVLGALATAGADKVTVYGNPRLHAIVTGDEVIGPGRPLQLGQVRDSNGRLMSAQFLDWGLNNFHIGHENDDEDRVRASLDHAFESANVIVTSGGVSVGDYDFIPRATESVGGEVLFWKVAQKPGMPLFVATRGGTLLLGLPGNPGAVFVNLHVYVRATLDAMTGLDPRARWRRAPMPEGVRREQGKTFWLRAVARYADDGGVRLEPLTSQASHMLSNLAAATALVRIPPEGEPADTVDWLPL